MSSTGFGTSEGPIADVREGMRVVDRRDEDVGTVEVVKMGDPEAVTPSGQEVGTLLGRPAVRRAGRAHDHRSGRACLATDRGRQVADLSCRPGHPLARPASVTSAGTSRERTTKASISTPTVTAKASAMTRPRSATARGWADQRWSWLPSSPNQRARRPRRLTARNRRSTSSRTALVVTTSSWSPIDRRVSSSGTNARP
jgi:hypothetical protein